MLRDIAVAQEEYARSLGRLLARFARAAHPPPSALIRPSDLHGRQSRHPLHLEHRRAVAGRQALDRFDGEQTVWRGLANLDAQILAQLRKKFIRPAQRAGQIGAHLDAVASTAGSS